MYFCDDDRSGKRNGPARDQSDCRKRISLLFESPHFVMEAFPYYRIAKGGNLSCACYCMVEYVLGISRTT